MTVHLKHKYFYEKIYIRTEDTKRPRRVRFKDGYSGRHFDEIGGTDGGFGVSVDSTNTNSIRVSSTPMAKDDMEPHSPGDTYTYKHRIGVSEIFIMGTTVDDAVEVRAW